MSTELTDFGEMSNDFFQFENCATFLEEPLEGDENRQDQDYYGRERTSSSTLSGLFGSEGQKNSFQGGNSEFLAENLLEEKIERSSQGSFENQRSSFGSNENSGYEVFGSQKGSPKEQIFPESLRIPQQQFHDVMFPAQFHQPQAQVTPFGKKDYFSEFESSLETSLEDERIQSFKKLVLRENAKVFQPKSMQQQPQSQMHFQQYGYAQDQRSGTAPTFEQHFQQVQQIHELRTTHHDQEEDEEVELGQHQGGHYSGHFQQQQQQQQRGYGQYQQQQPHHSQGQRQGYAYQQAQQGRGQGHQNMYGGGGGGEYKSSSGVLQFPVQLPPRAQYQQQQQQPQYQQFQQMPAPPQRKPQPQGNVTQLNNGMVVRRSNGNPSVHAHSIVYQVQFKLEFRYFVVHPQFLKDGDLNINDFVIVEGEKGEDLGIIVEFLSTKQYTEKRNRERNLPQFADEERVLRYVLRIANPWLDCSLLPEKYHDEKIVVEHTMEVVSRILMLPMQVVAAEYQFDRTKLYIFYTANTRVDFRELISKLYAIFKTCIWLKKLHPNQTFDAKRHAVIAMRTGSVVVPNI